MNYFPNKKVVLSLRERYPKHTRVELIEMNDPYSKLVHGDQGFVECIDDTGTIFVQWDNRESLGIVYGEDRIRKV